jgi:type I restriction enzyme S subunit
MLSVYRDYGVVEKDGRDDNYNKTAENRNIYQLVDKGWLVVNRMKAWQGSVGVSAYRGIVSGHYICFRPRHCEDSRFLNHLLRSDIYIHQYARISRGVRPNQIEIDNNELKLLPVRLPDSGEQRRVAEFLDAETAILGRLTEVRKAQVAALDERVRVELSELFVPGCVNEPRGVWPWPWLPATPGKHPLVRLGYVAELQSGVTVDSARDVGGDVVTRPYLRVANVQAGRLTLDNVTEITVPRTIAARCTLRPGDVLMTEGGDLDKLGRGTVWRSELPGCLHQNHIFAIRPDVDRLDADYLALMTRTLHGRCYFESTGIKTTNLASTNSDKIQSFPIPLPPLSLQRALVGEATRMLDSVERAKEALRRQVDLLAERKQALIAAAVTGQIDVTTARGVEV